MNYSPAVLSHSHLLLGPALDAGSSCSRQWWIEAATQQWWTSAVRGWGCSLTEAGQNFRPGRDHVTPCRPLGWGTIQGKKKKNMQRRGDFLTVQLPEFAKSFEQLWSSVALRNKLQVLPSHSCTGHSFFFSLSHQHLTWVYYRKYFHSFSQLWNY